MKTKITSFLVFLCLCFGVNNSFAHEHNEHHHNFQPHQINESETPTYKRIKVVCPTTISSFPYTEGFESGLGQWSQSGGDDLDWTRDSGGTPSNNTGPSSAYEGTWYMYIEASSPNFPAKTAGLISPCFNLTGMQTASLTFQYHMYGTVADMDLDVQISTDGGASWSSAIWSQTGNQGNQWNSATVNLDAYTNQYVMLRFWGTTGDSWQGDIAIDDIGFDAAPPACTPGTGLR